MTNEEAKELSLEVWIYFRDHSYIEQKRKLPTELYLKIKYLVGACPLCVLFQESVHKCPGCPLDPSKQIRSSFYGCHSYYNSWKKAKNDKDRSKYAGKIVELIEAWDTDGQVASLIYGYL